MWWRKTTWPVPAGGSPVLLVIIRHCRSQLDCRDATPRFSAVSLSGNAPLLAIITIANPRPGRRPGR
jgi:hypothetical protein